MADDRSLKEIYRESMDAFKTPMKQMVRNIFVEMECGVEEAIDKYKDTKEKEDAEKYKAYCQELESLKDSLGDFDDIRRKANDVYKVWKNADDERNTMLEAIKLKNEKDNDLNSYAAMSFGSEKVIHTGQVVAAFGIGLFILGVILYWLDISPLYYICTRMSIFLVVGGWAISKIWRYLAPKANEKISETNSEFKLVHEKAEKAMQERDKYMDLVRKIDFVEKYIKEH